MKKFTDCGNTVSNTTIVAWLWESDLMASLPCETCVHNWTSVSEPHTSAVSVEFCLYGTASGPYVAAATMCHFHHVCLLSCPLHGTKLILQCPAVRPHLSNADSGRAEGLRTKEPLHCVAYALLPRSCSPHNALYSPHITV